MEITDKLTQLGKVNIHQDRGASSFLTDYINGVSGGLVLLNENSMIDTERLDLFDAGRVGSQSVNLSDMTGNPRVLEVIRAMKEREDCTFFSGTLLRDFGNYVLPVMPVIQNGKILQERAKQTGIAYVDSYTKLAKELFGDEYAEKLEGFSGMSTEEPMKTLQDRLKTEVRERRAGFSKTFDVNGLRILPVICNELLQVPRMYQGKCLDVLAHSSDSLNPSDASRIQSYKSVCKKLDEVGKVNTPLIILSSEVGEAPHKGIFYYDGKNVHPVKS
jgi:hypothetical protein